MKIIEYQCVNEDSADWVSKAANEEGLSLPEAYLSAEGMAKLAKTIKEIRNHPFCILPFCHTLEGEALGGIINYGDEKAGPRVKAIAMTSLEEVLDAPKMDFTKGRLKETLQAISILKEAGEVVLMEISGPITFLSTLVDATLIYKALRKDRPLVEKVFSRIMADSIEFTREIQKAGATIISFADSTGGVSILGPKLAAQIVTDYSLPWAKKVQAEFGQDLLFHLCPKTTYALLGTEVAGFKEVPVTATTYGEALLELRGKVTFLGDRCLNHLDHKISGFMREIELKKESLNESEK